jgi:hypothetical protein
MNESIELNMSTKFTLMQKKITQVVITFLMRYRSRYRYYVESVISRYHIDTANAIKSNTAILFFWETERHSISNNTGFTMIYFFQYIYAQLELV